MFAKIGLFFELFSRLVDAIEKGNELWERHIKLKEIDAGIEQAEKGKDTSALESAFHPQPTDPQQ